MTTGRPSGIILNELLINQLFLELGRSYQEIADLCGSGLTRQAVYKWKTKGKIPVQHISRLVRFLKSDSTKTEDQNRTQLILKLENILETEYIDTSFIDQSLADSDSNEITNSNTNFLTDQELVTELERRGWSVTLQIRPAKQ